MLQPLRTRALVLCLLGLGLGSPQVHAAPAPPPPASPVGVDRVPLPPVPQAGGAVVPAPPAASAAPAPPPAAPAPFAALVQADDEAPRRDATAAVHVLGGADLLGRGPRRSLSLGDALAGEAGVRISSAGGLGQYSAISQRGALAAQVLLLLDGVPLNRGGQGAVDLSQLPIDGLARIEIYRGAPPLEFGSEAIGGAINLVTRGGGGPALLKLSLGGGSFGLRRAGIGYSSGDDRLRIAANLSYQGATGDFPYYFTAGLDYTVDERNVAVRRNDGFDQVGGNVLLSARRGATELRVKGQGFLKRQGVAAFGQPGSTPGRPDLTLGRAVLAVGARRDLRRGQLDGEAFVHLLVNQARDRPDVPDEIYRGDPDLAARSADTLSLEAGGHLLHTARPLPALRTKLMAELRDEVLRSRDLCPAPRSCPTAVATTSDRLRLSIAAGADAALLHDRLLFESGLHLLYARSRLAPLSGRPAAGDPDAVPPRDDLFVSPRLGARVRLVPWLLVRASAGRFLRLPTFLELFGDNAFFRGNLDLRPESAWTAEGGVRASGRLFGVRLLAEVSGFYRLVADLIQVVRNPTFYAENVGRARMAGVEAEASAQLGERLGLRLTYTFLDARRLGDEDGGDKAAAPELPQRPRHSLTLRAEGGLRALRAYYELDYTSQLYLDPGNNRVRPARALHALGLSIGPHAPLLLTLGIEVYNLLDTRVVDVPLPLGGTGRAPLSDFFDYPLPGRTLYVALSAQH